MLVVCLLALFAAPLFAQGPPKKQSAKRAPAPAAAPKTTTKSWPIESITVEGNKTYTDEQVLRAAGLKTGQVAGEPEFEAARARLLAASAFETVGYKFAPAPNGKGIAAVIEVAELQQVYPIRYEHLPASKEEIDAALRGSDPLFGERIPGTKAVLDRYAAVIAGVLEKAGKKEAVVGRVVADDNDQLTIVFRPASAPPVVAEVKFTGNQALQTQPLQAAVAPVAIGSAYSETRMRQILEASVRPVYERSGRLRVSFPKIESEPARDVTGYIVTVHVQEGEEYRLGDVKIQTSALPVKELEKAAAFAKGEVANFDAIGKGVDRLLTLLRNNGYMRAEAKVDRRVDDAARRVDLDVIVTQGPRFHAGKLHIKGLDIHGEAAIRKLWTLKEGKPFEASYPEYFLSRVREDGVFDNLKKTKSEIKVDEAKQVVDVTLIFN